MEEDGVVYDDYAPTLTSSFNFYRDVVDPTRFILTFYGWYILIAAFVAYQAYLRFLKPHVQQTQQARRDGEQKKHDDLSADRYRDALKVARERQQAHHDKVAAEAEEQRKRKEEEKRARLIEELAQRSVLENALSAHKMGVARKEREEKTRLQKGDTEETAADFLMRIIASAPIVIVSKSFCPFSRKAKSAFATYRLPRDEVVYLELDELGEKREKAVQAELARLYQRERVPAIFVSGDLIGDADEIVAHQREGILDLLVKDATESWRKRQL